jgi:hypothetical protein
MPAHRAGGIGYTIMTILSMRARTARVVFAAKLLKKLVLHALSLLSLPSIKAFAGTCARSTIALLRRLQSPLEVRR